jgi:hypothetical protein
MRRSGPVRVLAVLLLLSVALLALQQSAVSQSALPADALGHRCPPLPARLASIDTSGDWAIRPRLHDTTAPTFSEQDARDYVARHGSWIRSLKTPRITSVRFMSARSACVETGRAIGRPDDALVCLIILRGDFAFAGPPDVHGVGNTEYLVFDATTGNLIGISLSGH